MILDEMKLLQPKLEAYTLYQALAQGNVVTLLELYYKRERMYITKLYSEKKKKKGKGRLAS